MRQARATQVGVACANSQTWLHSPQFFVSLVMSTSQALLASSSQSRRPAGQDALSHRPAWQIEPPLTLHTLPQLWQLVASFCRSKHWLPHLVKPGSH